MQQLQLRLHRCRRRFDLNVQAFDCVLAKLSTSHYVWYFNQHHLITDARSTELVFERVSTIYADLANGTPQTKASLPTFEDYAIYEAGGGIPLVRPKPMLIGEL